MNQNQTEAASFEEIDLKTLLIDLGFSLADDGKYWRAAAIYRDGNNKTALRISKVTGGFTDFVEGKGGTLKDLLELMTGRKISTLDDYFTSKQVIVNLNKEKPKVTQEKTYSEEKLSLLFSNYSYYQKKGIDKQVLIDLKSGLAHEGQMYMRYVFPIYNKKGEIHGFTGRDITGKHENDLKWKKIGRSTDWVYPVYVPNSEGELETLKAINETREVIIVESIGDMLSLHNASIKNVVVTFGTKFSPALASFIASARPLRVIIATNNDFANERENVGEKFAFKVFYELCKYVDFQKICISLPQKKDFGEMNEDDVSEWVKATGRIDRKKIYKEVLAYMRNVYKQGKMDKSFLKIATAIKDYVDFS